MASELAPKRKADDPMGELLLRCARTIEALKVRLKKYEDNDCSLYSSSQMEPSQEADEEFSGSQDEYLKQASVEDINPQEVWSFFREQEAACKKPKRGDDGAAADDQGGGGDGLMFETLDVFTAAPFGGSPMAVVFGGELLSDEAGPSLSIDDVPRHEP